MTNYKAFDQNKLFENWVSWVVRHPVLVISLALLLTITSAICTVSFLSINTDTEDMLSPELPFRKNSAALSEAFPQFSDNIVVVVDAPTSDQAHDAADLLYKSLKNDPSLFGKVYDPAGAPFFRRNWLMYMELDELEDLIDQLVAAQPFLGRLNASPTLPELFRLIEQVVENRTKEKSQSSIRLASSAFDKIAEVMESQLAGSPHPLSWRDLISGKQSSLADRRRVIVAQPITDFTSLQPGKEAIDAIRSLAGQLNLKERFDAKVRLTGSLALSHEELESVIEGLGLAGIISIVLVVGLLFLGLRSVTLLISSLTTLISGLILTAGFATASVGTLNLISITFSVLFIGLSVDFAIHYCLRYQENARNSEDHARALVAAAKGCGRALALAAVAAAIGFFSFLPTDYIGLAELGLIAGTGMLIALLANFSVLPALIFLLPKPKRQIPVVPSSNAIWFSDRDGVKILVLSAATILVVISIFMFPRVGFDFDPMKLRNPETESVSTLLDIMSESQPSPYSITILNKTLDVANLLSKELSPLPTVDSTMTLSSFVPMDQEDKLDLIENLSLILSPSLSIETLKSNSSLPVLQNSFLSLKSKLAKTLATPSFGKFNDSAAYLNSVMSQFESRTKLGDPAINQLEILLLGSFSNRLTELRQSLEATAISILELPASLRDRLVSIDGRAKLELYPAGNMQSQKALRDFVQEVQEIAPHATGAPVSIFEAGKTVVQAFTQAVVTTVILIAILVLFLTRRLREIILIFAPLLLAALMTGTASVIFVLPFNFANVIVLPLLFGLGIAGNIHMVIRERQTTLTTKMMSTTTPRAVLYSALTTIGSFGSISLSSHPGTSSMGMLLTIAIVSTLICTLIFLPALMSIWPTKIRNELV